MEERDIMLALHETEGIGAITIAKIVSDTPRLQDIVGWNAERWKYVDVTGSKVGAVMSSLSRTNYVQRMERNRRLGIGFVTVFDEQYPPLLRQMSPPPWVLYYKGDISLAAHPMPIGIVGTRTPTVYGKKVSRDLASGLSMSQYCIVSGLASGIDSEAHIGALQHGGATVAVLGTGVDVVYPKENASLYRQIADRGLLVTEYLPGTQAQKGLFPLRNRIIAGMTWGTVVVEAAERSGSLITADYALDMSRDVFCVPGPITSPKSRGTLNLIKEGAKVVTEVEDIREEYYNLGIPSNNSAYLQRILPQEEGRPSVALSEDESMVLALLSTVPVSIDVLVEQTGLQFGHLHSVLLSLLMRQKIAQLPGSAYITIS